MPNGTDGRYAVVHHMRTFRWELANACMDKTASCPAPCRGAADRHFQPIILLTRGHLLLAVSPKSQFQSVRDIIEEAKRNPGKLTNSSSASGSPGHIAGELFKVMTGTDIVHVPYRGGANATSD